LFARAQLLFLGRGKPQVHLSYFLRFWKLQRDVKNSATVRPSIRPAYLRPGASGLKSYEAPMVKPLGLRS